MKVEIREVEPNKWAAINPRTGAYQTWPERWMAEAEAKKFRA